MGAVNARLIGGPKDGTILDLEFCVRKIGIPIQTEAGTVISEYILDDQALPSYLNSPLIFRYAPVSQI